jgi:hypothetical protein
MIRGVLVFAIAVLLTSCMVRRWVGGPRLTGTCGGACAHYVDCKAGSTRDDRTRCEAECPEVFADRDSLMAFESLSCQNAVEYVDGTRTATTAR